MLFMYYISLVSKLSSSDFLKLKADFVGGQNNWKYLIIISTPSNAQVLRFSTFTFRLSGKHDVVFSFFTDLKKTVHTYIFIFYFFKLKIQHARG